MSIEQLSAVEIGRKIARREVSSREVSAHFLDRIQACDPSVRAFVGVNPERVLQVAELVDQRIASGDFEHSPLAGVPVAIKDNICISGEPTTCASRMLANYSPPYSATSVEKLLAGGLVPLGKTNLDEFAMGGSTETGVHGITCNPWDTSRTPGGSSGGAAAALAAGMAPICIGSDTGGSVRQPAAFCGNQGLKPTYGRISRFGLIAFASSLDQIGPLAHHAKDLAATLQLLAGHDPRDSTSLDAEVPDYTAALDSSLKGLRVGIIREHVEHPALAESVRSSIESCGRALQDAGAELVDVHLPHTQYSVATYYLVATSEASGNLERYAGIHFGFRQIGDASNAAPLDAMIARSRTEGFGTEVKRRIMLGTFALSAGYYDAYYKKALQVRRLIAEDYRRAFENVDVLLGPVAPTTAFKIGEKINDPVQMYLEDLFTVGANLAGIPGLSIPCGLDADNLPLAAQLQVPALGEGRLLNIAHRLQQSGFLKARIAS